jgi:hypothetical protein
MNEEQIRLDTQNRRNKRRALKWRERWRDDCGRYPGSTTLQDVLAIMLRIESVGLKDNREWGWGNENNPD